MGNLFTEFGIKASGGASGLYDFTSHTFTNCGTNGPYGPSLSQVRSTYSGQDWAQSDEFLYQGHAQGIQLWTVPADGTYRFVIAGASSVRQYYGSAGPVYGRGAKFTVDIQLTMGEKLRILVGQLPLNSGGWITDYSGQASTTGQSCFNGGGGGTFVTKEDYTPLVIAGGGGSQRTNYTYIQSRMNAKMDFGHEGNYGGQGTRGTSGNGDQQSTTGREGSGGAGFYSDAGSVSSQMSSPARGFNSGTLSGRGAIENFTYGNVDAHGGFGGGGAGGWGGSGGGGGYSGGGKGTNTSSAGYGGGGSNYVSSNATVISNPSEHSGAGYVQITLL